MKIATISDELQIETANLRKGQLVFRAVNNSFRLQILSLLHSHKRMMVTAIYKTLSLEQPNVSAHLSVLRKAGIVNVKREGKFIYYSINYERLYELHTIAAQLLKMPGDRTAIR